MATERERARCRERLETLSASALDCESIRREAMDLDLLSQIGPSLSRRELLAKLGASQDGS
jgi:hypothetical protein